MYLDIGVYEQIQGQFEEESQVELPDFLLVRITNTFITCKYCILPLCVVVHEPRYTFDIQCLGLLIDMVADGDLVSALKILQPLSQFVNRVLFTVRIIIQDNKYQQICEDMKECKVTVVGPANKRYLSSKS